MADADELRERLRGLSRANQPALGSDLSERMAAQLRAVGPGIVRRSRRRRALVASSLAVLPSLIIVGVWGLQRAATSGTRAEVESRPKAAQCAALAVPAAQFAALPAGRRLLDLGARGRIALDAGGVAELVSTDPCKLELRLAQGRVSVHAQNLFGGELRVRAGATDVVVHGTRFAVDRGADGVTVDVDEGAVGVERAGRPSEALVRGGQRLRVSSTHAPVLIALAEEQRLQLRAALAFAPVTHVAQPQAAVASLPAVEQVRRSAAVLQEPRVLEQPARSITVSQELAHSSAAPRARRLEEPARSSAASQARAIAVAPVRVAEESSTPSAAAAEEPARSSAPAPSEAQAREVAPQPEPARAAEPAPAPAPPARREPAPQPPAARAATAAQLVARADALWTSGNRGAARDRYREAGAASNDPTAEAAWLALARRELSIGHADDARAALASYAARFPGGELRDEAVGIAFRAALADDDLALAERLARSLVAHHPGTTQARAAARWLRERGLPP